MDDELLEKIQPFRDRIDAIDDTLITLLAERASCVKAVGQIKQHTDRPVYRPEREIEIIRRMQQANTGPLPPEAIERIWTELMSACRALERRFIVAYLGPEGTFTEQAAIAHFGQAIDFHPCVSIDDVFRTVEAGAADFGVVPVENSAEGAVSRTLDLLLDTRLKISGERAIPVHHNLLTRSGNLSGVKKVQAHSQALAQCQGWLSKYHPELSQEAAASNAQAARQASEDPTIAAIASLVAARHFGLQVVNANIQDDVHNRTRFFILGELETWSSGSDKTSLILSVPNKPGAVYQMLAPLAAHGVSMTRFESRPARTGEWEYFFFVDIVGHQNDADVTAALNELREQASFFKVLGSYPV